MNNHADHETSLSSNKGYCVRGVTHFSNPPVVTSPAVIGPAFFSMFSGLVHVDLLFGFDNSFTQLA
jgi:hypothetical protein